MLGKGYGAAFEANSPDLGLCDCSRRTSTEGVVLIRQGPKLRHLFNWSVTESGRWAIVYHVPRRARAHRYLTA